MSSYTDAQRAEEAFALRVEKAKDRLLTQQRVLALYVEGLGPTLIASRLGRSRSYVIEVQVWLGLRNGRVEDRARGRRRDRMEARS